METNLGRLGVVLWVVIALGICRPPVARAASASGDEFQKREIHETGERYEIACSYPVTGNPTVDRATRAVVAGTIPRFKHAIANAFLPTGAGSEYKYNLTATYSTTRCSPDVIGFRFEIYSFTGGAHGMTTIVTRNFRLPGGQQISLDDVFRKDADYLPRISVLTVEKLRAQLGKAGVEKEIRDGAGPKKRNFTRFNLAPDALVFYFEQYAVACYAAGPQEVRIPLEQLKDLLLPPFLPASK